MATITFMYRLRPHSFVYHGKICMRFVPEEHVGLDRVIRPIVQAGIAAYRASKGYTDLVDSEFQLGVLGLSTSCMEYCSEMEYGAFDFYSVQKDDGQFSYWMNGQKLVLDGVTPFT